MTEKKYDSGLSVLIEENRSLRSVAVGIMVGTGSGYETTENNGISHFIEHMQFKGTEKRTARQIAGEFDAAGAVFNAYTSKEYTCFYFKSIDEKTAECFDVLSDLFLHSSFEKAELDRERKVIVEEINMSKDEPDGVCYDVLFGTMYGGSLGMEILGSKSNVERFGKADILDYKKTHYLPSNTTVAFVGNISAADALALVEDKLGEFAFSPFAPSVSLGKQDFRSGYGEYIKDFEQSELSIAFPALDVRDERVPVLSALDCIAGSGMSSRMFQRLREQLGLVYSVYTAPFVGSVCGAMSVCFNASPANVEKSVVAVREELNKLATEGVTDDEIQKAKTQLKVNAVFGKENPMTILNTLLRRHTLCGEVYDIDKLLARIDKITASDVNALAKEIFEKAPAIAYAGKKPPCDIERTFIA